VEGAEQVVSQRVERAEDEGIWQALPLALGAPAADGWTEAVDAAAPASTTWRYRVVLVLPGGMERASAPVAVSTAALPARLAWRAVEPNPFVETVTLRLAAPAGAAVHVTVHDLRGARVATLQVASAAGGEVRVAWNGRREDGSAVPAGVYLVRASGASASVTRRVVRVR
jgi:hypothetical protein